VKLFHGTASSSVTAILRDGLKPSVAPDLRGLPLPGASEPRVWLTTNLAYAERVATQAGTRDGTVLLVRVKDKDLHEGSWRVWFTRCPIPPERITRY
jgi:hypothetical protein